MVIEQGNLEYEATLRYCFALIHADDGTPEQAIVHLQRVVELDKVLGEESDAVELLLAMQKRVDGI